MKWSTGRPIPDDAKMFGAIPVRSGTSKIFGAIPVGTNAVNFGAIQKPGYPNGRFVGSHWVQVGV